MVDKFIWFRKNENFEGDWDGEKTIGGRATEAGGGKGEIWYIFGNYLGFLFTKVLIHIWKWFLSYLKKMRKTYLVIVTTILLGTNESGDMGSLCHVINVIQHIVWVQNCTMDWFWQNVWIFVLWPWFSFPENKPFLPGFKVI